MLSDEEKKAIETIKDFKNLKWYEHAFDNGTEVLDEEQKQDIDTILNLIEKQSKEIEEYKKQLDLDYVDNHFVPIERYNQLEKEIEELKEDNKKKSIVIIEYQDLYEKLEDKIKAKIEEIAKEWAEGELDGEWYEFIKYHLQSLLEKE